MTKLLKYVAIFMVALAFPAFSSDGVQKYNGALLVPEPVTAPPIVNYIKKVNPKLDDRDAIHLAKTIFEKAREHGIHPTLFAAQLRQESSFRLNLKVCHGFEGNCDYGLGQISSIWVKKWKLDTKRLQYDVAYNLDVAARIVRYYMELRPNDPNAYSMYYNMKSAFRKDYEKRVEKWRKEAVKLASL